MKIGQIIKYSLLTLGAATLIACATSNKQKIEYSPPVQKAEYSKPADITCSTQGCGDIPERELEITMPKVEQEIDIGKLVECLAEKGAKLYGASYCGPCKDKKKKLGKGADKLYVECSDYEGNPTKICKTKGINSYPTWIINGKSYTWEKTETLEQLSDIAGCNLK